MAPREDPLLTVTLHAGYSSLFVACYSTFNNRDEEKEKPKRLEELKHFRHQQCNSWNKCFCFRKYPGSDFNDAIKYLCELLHPNYANTLMLRDLTMSWQVHYFGSKET